jgi:hypothetical protein
MTESAVGLKQELASGYAGRVLVRWQIRPNLAENIIGGFLIFA